MSTTSATASLIDLAAQGRLPLHQYMDRATIDWIRENRPDLSSVPSITLRSASKELLRQAALPARWLAEPHVYESIHGVRHSMRVTTLATLLAEEQGLDDEDTATAVVAAAVHDWQRLHDKDDRGHGARAALWLAANANTVWGHFGLTAVPSRIVRAATAVRLHDVPYDAFSADDRTDHQRTERICDVVKAADALDRYRLPKLTWWPDARHVRVPAFERFKALAFDLVVISETAHLAGASGTESVRYALAETGLV